MGSRWRKAKMSLGLNLCVYVPRTLDDDASQLPSPAAAASPRASSSSCSPATGAGSTGSSPPPVSAAEHSTKTRGGGGALMPTTPTPTSSGLRLSKSGSNSFKKTCAICLTTMKPGQGHALFTAECSHTFHFHCIAANVKHGSHDCPVCRVRWKEIPFRGPLPADFPQGRARSNPVNGLQNEGHMNILRPLPRAHSSSRLYHLNTLFPDSDPNIFDDDEPLEVLSEAAKEPQQGCSRAVEIKTFPEFTEIPETTSEENFTILIHLKAPVAQNLQTPSSKSGGSNCLRASRAPVDLITVLDISGSMAGTKLALLKRAMGFVIQNLGPADRLSVIAFSSAARRLFPLRRMTDSGRQQSLLAVNSLTSNGGTNIAEGLRKGSKVIEERQAKNPVCSVILLSDGQDTYTLSPTTGVDKAQQEYCTLLPSTTGSQQVQVHVFGFGTDHDSASLHSISQTSGGTFSFIETEAAIQDAFAQCIGGLLSVVAQGMHVKVESQHPDVYFSSIKSGSYSSRVADDKRSGSIDVGDLYAEEERDFLVSVNVPPGYGETALTKVGCFYEDPLMEETVKVGDVQVTISRPAFVSVQSMSVEVDRQRNRLYAAEVMAEARSAAERGDLTQAVSLLEDCRRKISESPSGQAGERLCVALDAELKEMQERMANRQRYEESGRAYVLSGLSSHSWQRATARGDSTSSDSLVQSYQTSSMVDMLLRSQTMSRSTTPRQSPQMRHAKSFPARPQPR